jgi:hypothetical protein
MAIRFLTAALVCLLFPVNLKGWGFFAHQRINRQAVFSLPPEMLVLYKPYLEFLAAHAVDPDKRRYAVAEEGARHYIDIDHYGLPPFDSLPRSWRQAVEKYTEDTLMKYGVLPWHIERMLGRLTAAFQNRDAFRILKLSAELGHYVADAHVPLHTCSNHNGQFTNQHGIHALWESRIPELLADKAFNYWAGKAVYLADTRAFTWKIILESAVAADSVLRLEKALSRRFPPQQRFAYEPRNGLLVRTHAAAYTLAYHRSMGNMVERRMLGAMAAVASYWYTAWVDAGQPSLQELAGKALPAEQLEALRRLDRQWKHGLLQGREHEE